MRTLPMPAEATLETLHECCVILNDYREDGCPGFPDSNRYVDALMAQGVTVEEAVELLSITWQNTEEDV